MPSLLWAMTVLPLARVLVEPAPIPIVFVPLYFEPLTVTFHFLLAPELIEAYVSVINAIIKINIPFTIAVLNISIKYPIDIPSNNEEAKT